MILAYLFDIDGTLLDSAEDICAAVSSACCQDGREPPDFATIRRYIGRPLGVMFGDFYSSAPLQDIQRLTGYYREHYRERGHRSTRVFPGVGEVLESLPGRKGTATTKHTTTTAAVLELFGLRRHFHHIQGSENGRFKPDPTNLLMAAEALGVSPKNCLMVGDTPEDIEAGRRAGMRTCAVGWGYGDPHDLRSQDPDYWVENPVEILTLPPASP